MKLHVEEIKKVDKFVYLGSVVSKNGGTEEGIKSRINKARHVLNTLRQIWRLKALSFHNKIKIFNTKVKFVLVYGSETWRVTIIITHKRQTFMNRCPKNILMVRNCLQRRTLEQDKTIHIGDGNKETEMGMDRSYTTQACSQFH